MRAKNLLYSIKCILNVLILIVIVDREFFISNMIEQVQGATLILDIPHQKYLLNSTAKQSNNFLSRENGSLTNSSSHHFSIPLNVGGNILNWNLLPIKQRKHLQGSNAIFIPLKIFAGGNEAKFPVFIETIVQRIQSYFSVYRHNSTVAYENVVMSEDQGGNHQTDSLSTVASESLNGKKNQTKDKISYIVVGQSDEDDTSDEENFNQNQTIIGIS